MSKTDELLSVLDLTEEEQVEFFYIKGHRQLVDTFPAGGLRIKYDKDQKIISVKHSQSKLRFDRCALADLAFRLRDEVIAKDDESEIDCWWCEASYQVYLYVIGEENERDEAGLDTWFTMRAQPIHWIIATLIAKELAGKPKRKDK